MSRKIRVPRTGWIWDIQKYAIHDGPGIRTLIFFKGCPLRCLWCCNPESQGFYPEILWLEKKCHQCHLCSEICPTNAISEDKKGDKRINIERCNLCGLCTVRCPGGALQLIGKKVTVDDLLREVLKDAVFFQRTGGGITLSGGEPAAQVDFAYELLRQYKTTERGFYTAVETCGYVDSIKLSRLLEYTDLFLYDIKHMDSRVHRSLTGASNELILLNARRISESKKKLIIRFPIIPGLNDDDKNIQDTMDFVLSLPRVEEINLLPYHRLGESKYRRLGRRYELERIKAVSAEKIDSIWRTFAKYKIRVKKGG